MILSLYFHVYCKFLYRIHIFTSKCTYLFLLIFRRPSGLDLAFCSIFPLVIGLVRSSFPHLFLQIGINYNILAKMTYKLVTLHFIVLAMLVVWVLGSQENFSVFLNVRPDLLVLIKAMIANFIWKYKHYNKFLNINFIDTIGQVIHG